MVKPLQEATRVAIAGESLGMGRVELAAVEAAVDDVVVDEAVVEEGAAKQETAVQVELEGQEAQIIAMVVVVIAKL